MTRLGLSRPTWMPRHFIAALTALSCCVAPEHAIIADDEVASAACGGSTQRPSMSLRNDRKAASAVTGLAPSSTAAKWTNEPSASFKTRAPTPCGDFAQQLLKHRLDQALVFLRLLRFCPVAHQGPPHETARPVSAVRRSLHARTVVLRNTVLRGFRRELVVATAASGTRAARKRDDRGCESQLRFICISLPSYRGLVCGIRGNADPRPQDEGESSKDSQKKIFCCRILRAAPIVLVQGEYRGLAAIASEVR
jgi:hypothetical protein